MKLALSADHAGYTLKQHLVIYLREKGHEVLDLGVDTADVPADYPDAAARLGWAVAHGEVERGILICGSGVGASIAATKMRGVYAAICHDCYSAAQGVEHDNMNVLCMGGRIIGPVLAEKLADAFVGARFTGEERHQRRLHKTHQIENGTYSLDR